MPIGGQHGVVDVVDVDVGGSVVDVGGSVVEVGGSVVDVVDVVPSPGHVISISKQHPQLSINKYKCLLPSSPM